MQLYLDQNACVSRHRIYIYCNKNIKTLLRSNISRCNFDQQHCICMYVCYALYMINKQQIHVYVTVYHLQGDVLQKQMFTTGRETNYLQLVSTLYDHMPRSLVPQWI